MTVNKIRFTALLLCIVLIMCGLTSCGLAGSGIESEADLVNKKIGVVEGSKSDTYAQKYVEKGCEIIKYNSRIDMIKAFDANEIDCAVVDKNHADVLAREYDTLEVLPDVLGEDSFAFYMLESKRVYTIMLNKALAALKENGTVDEIVNGYLSDPEYEYEFASEHDTSNGTFNISLDPSMYPYVYAADEEHPMPRGIAIALVDAICEYLGCGYTFMPVTTLSLNSTLYLGTADFSIGTFTPLTAEASGMAIVESDPIMTYSHAIVVKK